ncbi:MAG: nuclease, partial [Thermoanaerobaculia bacterium]|nr:nuclease [Thermoanaerobaculia bacterium]
MQKLPAIAVLYCAIALSSASPALAWGTAAHRIIAGIAEKHLTPQAASNVRILLQGKTLADVASWADELRAHRNEPGYDGRFANSFTGSGHFVDIPRTADAYDAHRDCARGDCIVAQVDRFSHILGDTNISGDDDRADALRFLVNLIGDVHDPLHCINDGDMAGNRVEMVFFGKKTNLHIVWDIGLLEHTHIDTSTYIDRLNGRLRDFDRFADGTPADWATQSHRIARDIAYVIPTGPDASQRYYEASLRPVEDQLMYAGARLARTLNQLIGGAPVPPPLNPPLLNPPPQKTTLQQPV